MRGAFPGIGTGYDTLNQPDPEKPCLLAALIAILSPGAAKLRPDGRSISKSIWVERLPLVIVAVLLIAAGVSEEASAQGLSRNTVYLEAHSCARDYSINYERRLGAHFSTRSGVMISSEQWGEAVVGGLDVTVIPVMVNLMDGISRPGKHRFELGAGAFLRVVDGGREPGTKSDAGKGGAAAAVEYRYQPLGDGLLVRIGSTLLISRHLLHGGFQLSLGYTF